jgi:hypothetical protein
MWSAEAKSFEKYWMSDTAFFEQPTDLNGRIGVGCHLYEPAHSFFVDINYPDYTCNDGAVSQDGKGELRSAFSAILILKEDYFQMCVTRVMLA